MQSKNLLLAVMGILSQSSAFVVGPSVRQTTHLGVATPPVPPPMDESQLFFVEGLWNVEEGSDNTESKQFSEQIPSSLEMASSVPDLNSIDLTTLKTLINHVADVYL